MNNLTQTVVIVTLQVEGLHFWKECPLDQMPFLREPHRHIFHIRCEKVVTHDDREVEIIQLKRHIQSYLFKNYFSPALNVHNFAGMSCEMIADFLVRAFQLDTCEVLEDGENGAKVEVYKKVIQ